MEPFEVDLGAVLDSTQHWLLIFFLILGLLLANAIYRLYFHPLSNYPGPKIASLSDIPYLYWTYAGNLQYKIKEFHDKYGPVVRLGPNSLVYRNPQTWKEIYGHKREGYKSFRKDPTFYVPAPTGVTLIGANDADHSRIRRLFSHAMSDRALREQEPIMQFYVDQLMHRLYGEVAASRPTVSIGRWFDLTTFDIIGDMAFGEAFGCLTQENPDPWVNYVYSGVKAAEFQRALLMYPGLAWIINKLLIPKTLVEERKAHFFMSADKFRRRAEANIDHPDMMTYVLKFDTEKGMTDRELEANAGLILTGGSQTTTTLLSGCIFYLARNPAVLTRLVDELRGSFQSKEEITFSAAQKLPYLRAVIEETLRIYCPTPSIFPRLVPKGGAMVDGKFVPQDVSVSVAHYSTYRSRSNFADPDLFIPERWLNDAPPKFQSDQKEALQPFSYGPRNCVGKNIAYAEVRIVLAKLLWHFDIILDPQCEKWDTQKSYSVWERPPLLITITPIREHSVYEAPSHMWKQS
ncbi:benzoate 4-monooxygenase cytochrome P450 [Aspergillus pseudonomiae]|uniref:Benzoate 4-monooxygenase cytochrome P450 n=1 Tax=Aspergillus pseudonomiae TaxID=1506151 RepID=A0A5N7CWV9_9EURO|nr:benzoate 4-monooxygenase cytochrome P450 [Aspergillus pseudonomiae]KAE8398257.1 benzoate 4-monooxygenase cytochrome P450 [Aspergillus pseudonomiae]